MKRILLIILSALIPLAFAACAGEERGGEPIATEPIIENKLPTMQEALANWAWAVSSGNIERASTHMAVTAYPFGCDFGKLNLAVGEFGQAAVEFVGEKRGDGGEQWYFPFYERITGPYFALTNPEDEFLYQRPAFIMDSSIAGAGLQKLVYEYDGEAYNYLPAAADEILLAEAMKGGRRVMESQLLASTEEGGRVCLFRYENLDGEGLFSVAYIQNDVILAHDFTAGYVDEEGAYWRVDLDPDQIGHVQALLLCRTREGVLLAIAWSAPEGRVEIILRERDGRLEEHPMPGMYYSTWEDAFYEMEAAQ